MIRTADIREKRIEIEYLIENIRILEDQIAEKNNYLQRIKDTDFEYEIVEASRTYKQRTISRHQQKIKKIEHEIRVMKGEVEPERVKPWTVKRNEIKLECFGVEV